MPSDPAGETSTPSRSSIYRQPTQATLELLDGWKQREVEEKAKDDAIRANIGAAPATLTLNVGGTMFTTSKTTLLRVKNSYFHVDGRKWAHTFWTLIPELLTVSWAFYDRKSSASEI
ncbi:unnamed protein product [Aphanomyces euteiches]